MTKKEKIKILKNEIAHLESQIKKIQADIDFHKMALECPDLVRFEDNYIIYTIKK